MSEILASEYENSRKSAEKLPLSNCVKYIFLCLYNKNMEFSFDKVADILYILIIRGDVEESEEIAPGIIIDYSKSKQILGLEILNFKSRNFDLNHLITVV